VIVARFDLPELLSVVGPTLSPKASRLSLNAKVFGYVFIARSGICVNDDVSAKRVALWTTAAAPDLLEYGQLFASNMNRNWLGSSGLAHVQTFPHRVSGRFGQPGNEVPITRDSSGLCLSHTRQLSRWPRIDTRRVNIALGDGG
jgi:hypothetical protein